MILSAQELAANLSRKIVRELGDKEKLVVGLYGDGGLGKSTVSNYIARRDPKFAVLSIDGFLPSRKDRLSSKVGHGDELVDFRAVGETITLFNEGKNISSTLIYDHAMGRSFPSDDGIACETNVLLVEGSLAAAYLGEEFLSFGILFDASLPTRRALRMTTDLARGYTLDEFEQNWLKYLSTYDRHINRQRSFSNIIIRVDSNLKYSIKGDC